MRTINKRSLIILALAATLIIVSACNLGEIRKSKELVATSVPPVVEPVDLSPFQNIGCTWQSDAYAVCPEGSTPKKMGCDTLSLAPIYLNLLDENSQFIKCSYAPQLQTPSDEGEVKGLYDSGCSIPFYERILTYKDGDYLLIRDIEDLKYYFAPIDSENKALGYAIAATGFSPRYTFEDTEDYRFLTEDLEPTQIKTGDQSYEINLFEYQLCGCGPHTYYMKRVNVSLSGDIEILDSIPVFENPKEDNLCVD